MNNEQTEAIKANRNGLILSPIAGKGGCGKTTFLAYLIAQLPPSIKPRVYDFEEGGTTGLSRYCPESKKLKLHKDSDVQRSDLDRLIDDFDDDPDGLAIVDLPANSGFEFLRWITAVPWLEIAERGIEIMMFASATDDSDSLRLSLPWVEALQTKVKYILVENQCLGSTFQQWKFSKQGISFTEIYKPTIVRFPKIPAEWAIVLENQGKTIFDPLHGVPGFPKLGTMDRSRVDRLRAAVRSELRPVLSLLERQVVVK
jgi:hypothetical protein